MSTQCLEAAQYMKDNAKNKKGLDPLEHELRWIKTLQWSRYFGQKDRLFLCRFRLEGSGRQIAQSRCGRKGYRAMRWLEIHELCLDERRVLE
jgi:hypothetical protein